MSQAGSNHCSKQIYGAVSKIRYEAYTDEELDSDEFFWNQLKLIIEMKNMEYFYHFINARSDYITRTSDM